MSNTIFAYPNRMDIPQVAGGCWDVNNPLTYLQTRQLDQKAQASNNDPRSTFFYLTTGAAILAELFGLGGHTLSTAGTYRLRGGFSADPKGAITLQFTGGPGTLDSRVTWVRGSIGTYIGSDGLLKTAAINEPRFEYDTVNSRWKGVIDEGAATNWCFRSRDLTNVTSWTTPSGGFTKARDQVGADGVANTATSLKPTAVPARLQQVVSAGTTAVRCFWLRMKRVGTLVGTVKLTGDGFGTTTDITASLTTAFKVFKVLTNNSSSNTVGIEMSSTSDTVIVDTVQVEDGEYPTSFIETTTAAVTRSADSWSFPMATYGITCAAGAMVCKCEMITGAQVTSVSSQLVIAGMYAVASGSNFIGFRLMNDNRVQTEVWNTNTQTVTIASSAVAVGSSLAMACSWGANDVRASYGGAAATQDTTVTLPTAPTTVSNDSTLVGTKKGGIILEMLRIYPAALANADLQSLSGSELELVATYDSGSKAAYPAAWVSGTTAEERQGVNYTSWHQFTATTQTHWRVDISDASNPYPVAVGRVFFGSVWQPSRNMDYGAGIYYKKRSIVTETYSGAEYFVKKNKPRCVNLVIDGLTEAEAFGKVFEMHRQLGETDELFWAWDPADTLQLPRRSFLCRMEELPPLEIPGYNRWKAGFRLKELL